MSAKQRLDRLRHLREMAANLHRSILDECDMAQAEVAAIDKQIAESEKRCEAFEQMVTWDRNQPDRWIKSTRTWRKAMDKDRGKMVRVSNSLHCDLSEMEQVRLLVAMNIKEYPHANLKYGGEFFICEGSKGQHVEWKYAWIEADPAEEAEQADDDGKGYISIQVGSFYPGEPSEPVVKEDLKTETAPTVNKPLTVEPPFKPGDFVRIAKPAETEISFKAWFPSMEGFHGAVRRVSKCNTENRSCTLVTCEDYVFPFSWLTKIES